MSTAPRRSNAGLTFEAVSRIALAMAGVTLETKYDGSLVLKFEGCFLAGPATHESAEPDTLVVRSDARTREPFLVDDPDTYYLTDYYTPHAVILVRLARVDRVIVTDLLRVSRRLTVPHTRRGHRPDA